MKQLIAPARGRHWAHINEFSFIAGMRLLFWLCRVFGRWPFRAVLYPVVLWYMLAKPAAARRRRRLFNAHGAARAASAVASPADSTCCAISSAFGENILDKMLLWSGGTHRFGRIPTSRVDRRADGVKARRCS